MDRRVFLAGLGAILAGSSLPLAAQNCVVVRPGVMGCTIGLSSHFEIVTQNCPERCWAASIAGIFGYQGHPIDQDVIAQTIYRTLACLPSISSGVLDTVLSHVWTDTNGDQFKATITGLYDPLNNVTEMDNDDLVSEMRDNNPVLYCNTHHAMVIVGMDYRRDAAGDLLAVDRVHVADPWPGNGMHLLTPPEMMPLQQGGQLTYVASVDVEDA
jgi:Papain-like cysteine protease AvrRpt2